MSWYGDWKPYVPVARRRAQAAKYAANLAKREKRELAPVRIQGLKIAKSFWGQAWCDNMERYSDFHNRLPRGRTYVRNGSVIDLQIERGTVKALVSGSDVYQVTIKIQTLAKPHWERLQKDCSQSVRSLIDLLQGRFDQGVMQRLTQRDGGLFPLPKEIQMRCTCPDSAGLCKHVAAVLYGVGARLDHVPELLFTLRDVDHRELVSQAVASDNVDRALGADADGGLATSDLSELFGIDIETTTAPAKGPARAKRSVVSQSQPVAAAPRRRKSALEPPTALSKKTPIKKRQVKKGTSTKAPRATTQVAAAKRSRVSAPSTRKPAAGSVKGKTKARS